MVQRFNAVARRGNLDFEAWFSSRTEVGRSWKVEEESWEFPYVYAPKLNGRTYALALPARLLRGSVPDVLVSLYASPSFLVGSAIAALKGARTAFWVEVTFDSWVTRRPWKERLKSMVFPKVDAILTAGSDGRDFALRYEASPERIFVVPHVVDVDLYARRSRLSPDDRDRIRAELGLRGVTFLYVGRLWRGKGLEYLVRAFAAIQPTDPNTTLLLVGDGADEGVVRAACEAERLDNVVFTGFHDEETLPLLYAAADVFVFPTLGDPFGMVVLEAMACGLPIIASSASGEIGDRVSDGENGFIIPPADSESLRDRMAVLAGDDELRARMGAASRGRVSGQSPEMWAEAFEHAIGYILATPTPARG
jgi:glycosyltransferase involved in cell wall biosynthesis